MVREFYIENETGQRFSMMNIEEGCFLSSPTGLGYSYDIEYAQIGNDFIQNIRKLTQGQIGGELVFKNYDNYKNFIDFIESAENLKFVYKVPFENGFTEYFKDIDISNIDKTEIGTNGVLIVPAVFNAKTLWYEAKSTKHEITRQEDEIRWDFRWDSRFLSNNSNVIDFNNKGHVPARVLIEVQGYVVNPTFKVEQNGKELFNLPINTTVELGEKLIFCSLVNNFYIKKVNMITEEETNLYTLDNIDFNKDYILTLPNGESSLTILTEETLNEATINIYSYYKAV